MDACFKNYLTLASKEQLLESFKLAEVLWIIYEALGQYRLMMACDRPSFLAFQRHGRLSGSLKEFITTCFFA